MKAKANGGKECRLCNLEALLILEDRKLKGSLNKRSEIYSSCRHEKKYLLKNWNKKNWRSRRRERRTATAKRRPNLNPRTKKGRRKEEYEVNKRKRKKRRRRRRKAAVRVSHTNFFSQWVFDLLWVFLPGKRRTTTTKA